MKYNISSAGRSAARPTGRTDRATARIRPLLLAVAVLASASTTVMGQGAAARLSGVREGQVRFTFTLRAGVCGQGQNIWRTGKGGGDGIYMGSKASTDVEYDVECDSGPGRVVIDKDNGVVQDVRFYVGGRWKVGSTATDLGALGAREAAALLLDIVRTASSKAADRAMFPLTLVDSAGVYRDLLRVARDHDRPSHVRKQAVFWLGQAAEGPATAGLQELVGEAALDRDVREQAIFALSQRPKDEGIPALINVVRSNRDPELRKKALFWLGQSGDPRAVDLIEELLTKR